MQKQLPLDLKRMSSDHVIEVLNLYVRVSCNFKLDQIISEYQLFNHSKYIYPLYQNFLKEIQSYTEDNENLPEEFQILKVRSVEDPVIKELLWEYDEYIHPISVQKIQTKQLSNKKRLLKKLSLSQICVPEKMHQNLPQSQSMVFMQSNSEPQDKFLDEIAENKSEGIPFDEASYVQELNFVRVPSQSLKEVVDQRIQQSKAFYSEALVDDAYYVIQQARADCAENVEMQSYLMEYYGEYVNAIESKIDHLNTNLKQLLSEGWIIEKQTKELTIKYKLERNNQISILMDAIFEANITKLMCLINEIDLYHNYVPFCMQSRCPKQINRQTKICDLLMYFPLVSNRRMCFTGEGIDRLKINGTIIFLCKQVEDLKEYGVEPPKDKDKYVDLILNYYIFELTPLPNDKCRVRAITNADPQIRFLPQALLALVSRKMAHTLFDKMQKITKNFEKSPWFARFNENKEFYQWIDQKVNNI